MNPIPKYSGILGFQDSSSLLLCSFSSLRSIPNPTRIPEISGSSIHPKSHQNSSQSQGISASRDWGWTGIRSLDQSRIQVSLDLGFPGIQEPLDFLSPLIIPWKIPNFSGWKPDLSQEFPNPDCEKLGISDVFHPDFSRRSFCLGSAIFSPQKKSWKSWNLERFQSSGIVDLLKMGIEDLRLEKVPIRA